MPFTIVAVVIIIVIGHAIMNHMRLILRAVPS